jgi:hypothetical protein
MMIPEAIRDGIRDKIWAVADELGWSTIGDSERSRYYELWTRDQTIGGQLAHFMDPRKVRVYIKDSLLKPYERARLLETEGQIWRSLGLSPPTSVSESYIKPHGRRLGDGRVICWGKSRDWKLVLMAVFERGRTSHEASPFGAVLLETGQTSETRKRALVKDAAARLGIQQMAWLE